MPPKTKYDPADIVDIAFNYVRKNGWRGLTTRYLSEQLNSSTMPIYSCFKSMAHLEEEVVKKAMALFSEYLTTPRTGDVWIDHGVGYVLFAHHEKYLFRSMFDEEHDPFRAKYSDTIWDRLGQDLTSYKPFKELTQAQVEQLRRGRWVLIHGLASLVNTGAIPIDNEQEIYELVGTGSKVLFCGVKDVF